MSILTKQILAFLPKLYRDTAEPFPIVQIGTTVFTAPGESSSFPGLVLNPQENNADTIIEYAIYFDYDIQHLYDLEHIWVAVKANRVTDCWCSFHGMRLHPSDTSDLYHTEDARPVLYLQPGKHALMPDPRLFGLHCQRNTCCREHAGGGLLIPPMLADAMQTDPAQDNIIRNYIRSHYSFTPTWKFVPCTIPEEIVTDWDTLKNAIPTYVRRQLDQICGKNKTTTV